MKLSLYIIIASRIQLFSRLRRFTSVERALQIAPFMQNEPNFRKSQMNVKHFNTVDYEKRTLGESGKNEPKTNPIYPCVASGEAGTNPIYPCVASGEAGTNPILGPVISKCLINY